MSMIHETLYKRAKTGKIQYWKVSVQTGDPDQDGSNHPQIVKSSGQLGTTSPITHCDVIRKGKNIGKANETTPIQQAELQALSDWTGKHDEGYKTLEDLGITDTHARYVEGDYNTMLGYELDLALPEFNTDANGNVKPMLAKSVNWNKVKYPCLVQPKLDGVRCLMVVNIYYEGGTYEEWLNAKTGSSKCVKIKMLSRKGKEFTTLDHIKQVIYKLKLPPQDFILDGEIYSDELSFQEISQAVKKQYPNSLKLKFRAYDIVTDSLQHTRLSETEILVTSLTSSHITMVTTHNIHKRELVKELHDQWVADGYEGAMIRLMDGRYGQGQRSSDLLKVKEYDEDEFAFKNFEFGQRGIQDLIAVCWTKDGKEEIRATVGGTLADKEFLYSLNDVSEGKPFTIKYFGFTDGGLLRHPIGKGFRDYE